MITRILVGTTFGYCAFTAALGRPASFLFFVICLVAAILGEWVMGK